jgi:hypothetical protein
LRSPFTPILAILAQIVSPFDDVSTKFTAVAANLSCVGPDFVSVGA